jgi:hypothetical protein
MGRDIHVIAAFSHRHKLVLYSLGVTAVLGLFAYLLRSKKAK